MSTKPGATTSPSTSITRAASSSTSPITTMRPCRMPTSPWRAGPPVPSTSVPPRTMTSSTSDLPERLEQGRGPSRVLGHPPVAHALEAGHAGAGPLRGAGRHVGADERVIARDDHHARLGDVDEGGTPVVL